MTDIKAIAKTIERNLNLTDNEYLYVLRELKQCYTAHGVSEVKYGTTCDNKKAVWLMGEILIAK